MSEKIHDQTDTGCPSCNPEASEATELCGCLVNGHAEGLRRWHDVCPCCFSDAYPEGLDAALTAATN